VLKRLCEKTECTKEGITSGNVLPQENRCWYHSPILFVAAKMTGYNNLTTGLIIVDEEEKYVKYRYSFFLRDIFI